MGGIKCCVAKGGTPPAHTACNYPSQEQQMQQNYNLCGFNSRWQGPKGECVCVGVYESVCVCVWVCVCMCIPPSNTTHLLITGVWGRQVSFFIVQTKVGGKGQWKGQEKIQAYRPYKHVSVSVCLISSSACSNISFNALSHGQAKAKNMENKRKTIRI